MLKFQSRCIVVLWSLLLTACGGGGGGDEPAATPQISNPTATATAFETEQDTALSGQLMASDPGGRALSYKIVGGPDHGSVQLVDAGKGAFVYTPNPGHSGSDQFSFLANNGQRDSNTVTVTITITVRPLNVMPTAMSMCLTTAQDATLNGRLSAMDGETPVNALRYSVLRDGAKGVVDISPDGQFSYTPNNPGARGSDSFVYQVVDANGGTDSGVITIIIDQKIMPLGDSITEGTGDHPDPPERERIGYRRKLYNDLVIGNAYAVDFVGSLRNGEQAVPQLADIDHEGHGGWNAKAIVYGRSGGYPNHGVRAWLNKNPADIVLLHIGTNNFDETTVADIEKILDEIDLWESANNPVTVIVARIIDRSLFTGQVTGFNDAVAAMAHSRVAAGDSVIVVDQQNALNYTTDMADGVHPAASGYEKMATVWLDALLEADVSLGRWSETGPLAKCP